MKTTTKKQSKKNRAADLKIARVVAESKNQQLAVVRPKDDTLALIDRAARDKSVDVPKMRELLDMKIKYESMVRQDAFQQAMIECQMQFPDIEAMSPREGNKGKYAKLVAIERAIKPIYLQNGLVPTYTSRTEGDQKYIGLWLMHRSGHKEYYELPGQIDMVGAKGNPNKTWLEGLGSMVSYLRRYLLCMAFNVTPFDEDKDGRPVIPDPTEIGGIEEVKDKFTETSGVTIENENAEWMPANGVSIKLKPQRITYKPDGGPTCVQAALYLMGVMGKRTHKQSRIDLINENLPLVAALVKAGKGDTVSELHKLADKGV